MGDAVSEQDTDREAHPVLRSTSDARLWPQHYRGVLGNNRTVSPAASCPLVAVPAKTHIGHAMGTSRQLVVATTLLACTSEPSMTKEQLGKLIFMDKNLSVPAGQACADCHAPAQAFRDPESDYSTSMGAVLGRFGARNAQTAMYAAFVPPLHFDAATQRWIGGLFWDGRADSLEAQAAVPLLNPLEMNNPDAASVVEVLRSAGYAQRFRDVFGRSSFDDVDTAFRHAGEAIAAYERTSELSPFSSKYDHWCTGTATLSAQELRGLDIFEHRGKCVSCHPPPLFTDFSYANLGIPRYPNNMHYRAYPDFVDHGLMQTTRDPAHDGKFRVPTLRNIKRTGPFSHNGYFENVPYMLDFLNTRDVGSTTVGTCSRPAGDTTARCPWPVAEITANVDTTIGNLGLDEQELADLSAFLDTLTDQRQ